MSYPLGDTAEEAHTSTGQVHPGPTAPDNNSAKTTQDEKAETQESERESVQSNKQKQEEKRKPETENEETKGVPIEGEKALPVPEDLDHDQLGPPEISVTEDAPSPGPIQKDHNVIEKSKQEAETQETQESKLTQEAQGHAANSGDEKLTHTAEDKAPQEIAEKTSATCSSVTLNVLRKLFQSINPKALKLNTEQKELVSECVNVLNQGEVPSVKIIDLLLKSKNNLQLKVLVVDSVSKVFTFENSKSDFNSIRYNGYTKFSDLCIDTIAAAFKDETDDAIELQIVKTMVNIILNDNVEVHTAKLLEGIRLIYNIFILTVNENIKLISEATLTQIIDYYFQKIESGIFNNLSFNSSASKLSSPSLNDLPETLDATATMNLNNLENLNEAEEKKFSDIEKNALNESTDELDKSSLNAKDCFLIFRAMSKLSVKAIDEKYLDARSTAVRSKLLSLKIIHSILKNHINCFINKSISIPSNINNEKIPFIDSVRNYLLLALTKNAVYQLNDIYSVCLDIFYIIITNLRADFINEIPVLFSEIFFPIVEMPVSTDFQKNYFLSIVAKLSNDPRLLIEFYLNFDCSENKPNIIESLINFLIKTENNNLRNYSLAKKSDSTSDAEQEGFYDSTSLNCIVSILRSLYGWSNKGVNLTSDESAKLTSNGYYHKRSASIVSKEHEPSSPTASIHSSRESSYVDIDDPTEFESLKKRKTLLLELCKLFNYKPKRGLKKLIDSGFIKSSNPADVAEFLLANNNILDKGVLGEFLGEGDDYNIDIMHSFVDQFNFGGLKFVDAMRLFLQSFRLPGESQKIDRFMLKFAETYYKSHPNSVFAQADTLYVLSYSVIMLNTDQHNNQVKSRMTTEDFIKNNSGIDDGKDLPRQLLVDIYNDIATNEIILESEQHHALISGTKNQVLPQPTTGLPNLFSNRNDVNKEYYIQAAKEISSKTEKAIKSNGYQNTIRKTKFFSASHVEHVKSIFDTLWMSFLAALTPSFKEFNNKTITKLCLEGIKLSIKIACIFNLTDAKTSFVNALLQFTNLNNVEEIKRKNLDAINVLLNICITDGNYLKSSWTDILVCVSQLERLQLIAQGIEASTIPDILNARLDRSTEGASGRTSHESVRTLNSKIFFNRKTTTPSELAQQHHASQKLLPEIASLIASTELTVKIDKIFASTEKLSIDAITYFVEALSEVALDEVQSSGNSNNPRIFSLQKMVDICYYNMGRIRLEWSRLWAIMNQAFNKIGCHSNLNIVIFALDSLRQLSVRFFDIEELAYFKFQKDFLKPFAFTLTHNEEPEVKVMVLECIDNMLSAKSDKIKSGWLTIFETFVDAAHEDNNELIVKTYKLLSKTSRMYFEAVYQKDAFTGLVQAYTALACNEHNQRISLHAISDMRALIRKVQDAQLKKGDLVNDASGTDASTEKTVDKNVDQKSLVPSSASTASRASTKSTIKFFPVLTGFAQVVLKNSDLESRSISLDHLFDTLVEYGEKFDESYWKEICEDLLFPIFGVLSNHWSQLNSHDDLSVWLSTTLIQALKNMVAIFTHFDTLLTMLDGYLKLLCSCILQENDTISRIGRNCLQNLILQNVGKFGLSDWNKVTNTLKELFDSTIAVELFLADPLRTEESNHAELEGQFDKPDTSTSNGFEQTKEAAAEVDHIVSNSDKKDKIAQEQQEADKSTDTVIIHDKAGNGYQEEPPSTPSQQTVFKFNQHDGLDVTSPKVNGFNTKKTKTFPEEQKKKLKDKGIIVVKCVLQLLMIETLSELFEDDTFYEAIPIENMLELIDILEKSYKFSHEFNDDYNLRVRLWNSGVIERLPNLLKQESSSSGVYINIIFRLLINGNGKTSEKQKEVLLGKLIPLCVKIIENYISLDETTKQRNINIWRPVVVEILQGYYELEEDDFIKHCPIMYDLVLNILDKQLPQELRSAIKNFLTRVGEVYVRI